MNSGLSSNPKGNVQRMQTRSRATWSVGSFTLTQQILILTSLTEGRTVKKTAFSANESGKHFSKAALPQPVDFSCK